MSRTSTDIANMTCDMILDQAPLGNLQTDMSAHGKYLRRNYLESVKTVISEGSWNECRSRAQLNEIARPDHWTVDDSGLQYIYPYPSDCVGLLEINDRPLIEVLHDVESLVTTDANGDVLSRQRVIVCNIPTCINLRYKALIDAADMGPHLAKAVALELGQRTIMKARNSVNALQAIKDLYADTTIGSSKRRGGLQVASRENRPQRPVKYASTGANARAGKL